MYKAVKIGNTYSLPKEVIRKYYKYVDVPWNRPNLTANGTMGGLDFAVHASNEYYVSPMYYPAWKAVNGTDTSGTDCWASTVIPVTYDFYNPEPLKVTKLTIKNPQTYTGRAIASGEVYTSDDNDTWTLFTSFTNTYVAPSDVWDIDLSSNTNFYKYHRIKVLSNSGNTSAIADLGITAYTLGTEESTSSDYDFYIDIDTYKAIEQ